MSVNPSLFDEVVAAYAVYTDAKEKFMRAHSDLHVACERWKTACRKHQAELASRVIAPKEGARW